MSNQEIYTTMHRHLPKAKGNPRLFVWCQSQTTLKRDGTPKMAMPSAPWEAHAAMLLNPIGVCNQPTLDRIEDQARRNVGAWILGILATEAQENQILNGDYRWSLITLNPLPASRDGRCEKVYHYCRFEDGKLTVEEPVVWSDVLAADFASDGASVYLKD